MTAGRMTEVGYGYTVADLDSMARQACAADRSLASDVRTRYDVAWSAIATAIVEAPHWPRRETLIQAGWQAIYTEVREMRHTFGFRDKDGTKGVASSPRFVEYWWHGTVDFEDALIERLALPSVLSRLTDGYRDAVTALAVHDDYQAAASAMGLKYSTFTLRVSTARRRIHALWFAPETAPKIRNTDRRVEAHGKPPATHCGAGHEWTPENTRPRRSQKGRDCRACERDRSKTRRALR